MVHFKLTPNGINYETGYKHLRTDAEDFVISGEGKPVSDIVLLNPRDGLCASLLRNVQRLDPSLDVLFRCKLKHLDHLLAVTKMRGTDVVTTGHELLSLHLR